MKYLLVLAVMMAGCASSRIAPLGPDTYLLHRSSGDVACSSGCATMNGLEDAGKYCANQGKKMLVVSTQQGGFESDIQFRCLAEGDKELVRPTLTPVPQSVIKVEKQ